MAFRELCRHEGQGDVGDFGIGAGLSYWNGVPFTTALFRGALLCVVCAVFVRMLLMSLFRAYIQQIHLRKQNEVLANEKRVNDKK